jgi:hypothetical protein
MRFPERHFNWYHYSVPEIALMLDENFNNAWNQALAWQSASVTIDNHRQDLARARAELAVAWPTKHSSASVVYFEIIDALDRSMAETADAALANGQARSGVLDALGDAKVAIDRLNEMWSVRVGFAEAEPTSNSGAESVVTGLNDLAHQIMEQTDQRIFEHYRQLRTPSPYSPPSHGNDESWTVVTGSTATESGQTDQNAASIHAPNHKVTLSDLPDRPNSPATPSVPASRDAPGVVLTLENKATNETGDAVASAAMGLVGGRLVDGLLGGVRSGRIGADVDGSEGSSEPPRSSADRYSGTAARQASQAEAPGSLLSPGIGATGRPLHHGPRRRRARIDMLQSKPTGVPGLLTPRSDEPIVHHPGPGVIGIDR